MLFTLKHLKECYIPKWNILSKGNLNIESGLRAKKKEKGTVGQINLVFTCKLYSMDIHSSHNLFFYFTYPGKTAALYTYRFSFFYISVFLYFFSKYSLPMRGRSIYINDCVYR